MQVVAVDEAQFFPDLAAFVVAAADTHAQTVLVAGLDGDFRRSRFGQVLDLVPHAESVTRLTARCGACGRAAPFSMRLAAPPAGESVVDGGGADKYAPACRACYAAAVEGVGSGSGEGARAAAVEAER